LFTGQLIDLLSADEEAPWGDWHGAPIKPRQVSRLLKAFGIRSKSVRLGDQTAKGYARADFADAWSRYLSPICPQEGGLCVTSVTTASLSQKTALASDVYPSHVTDHEPRVTDSAALPTAQSRMNTVM
jgi:hypothetical protein